MKLLVKSFLVLWLPCLVFGCANNPENLNESQETIEEIADENGYYHIWPTNKIAEEVNKIYPNCSDSIPSFEATSYKINYYSSLKRIAINALGAEASIVNTYKTKVDNVGWESRSGDSNDYFAISPNKQIEINFYYDSENVFNVDIAKYYPPVSGWPTSEIATVVNNMGATGTVLPYYGVNNGFLVDTDNFPPAILIKTSTDQEAIDGTTSYNNSLVDAGYETYKKVYNEDTYLYPGTTLAYRAAHLTSKYITIELFNADEI